MYELYIGNKNYSSWSLRPWILMRALDIPFTEVMREFRSDDNFNAFREFSPTGRVPCLVDDPTVVWDSLAITEYLGDRGAPVWPASLPARTFARCVSAEMHAGFETLRHQCPMNCALTVAMAAISDPLQRELTRLEEIFSEGLQRFGGPFLAGDAFTAADAFFCPVAIRISGYQLPVNDDAAEYCARLRQLKGMKEWVAAGISEPWIEAAHEAEARAAGEIIADLRLTGP